MLVDEFNYDLPEELVAQYPCEPRDASRLLVLERNEQKINHKHFHNLPDFLQPGDLLVFNDTRVIPARLLGAKADSGGKIEVFLLSRINGNEWEVLVKPGKKARPGTTVVFSDELQCEVLSKTDFGGRVVRFTFQGVFEEILDKLGETPLPPYIKERLSDQERYQTIYARERGSAAAPTAGLHFTHSLLERIKQKGVQLAFITLHVGLGTFRPVQVHDISEHSMHREYYTISAQAASQINDAKRCGRRVIAVGTTSVRTLETAAAEDGQITSGSGWTDIFIYPGYRFKTVDAMITNFHLPKSTLLMLISAFAGRDAVLEAYRVAVAEQYRFFSFGDAMLIL